jgi:hypothetical protein
VISHSSCSTAFMCPGNEYPPRLGIASSLFMLRWLFSCCCFQNFQTNVEVVAPATGSARPTQGKGF